jgi:hypothetical protein
MGASTVIRGIDMNIRVVGERIMRVGKTAEFDEYQSAGAARAVVLDGGTVILSIEMRDPSGRPSGAVDIIGAPDYLRDFAAAILAAVGSASRA